VGTDAVSLPKRAFVPFLFREDDGIFSRLRINLLRKTFVFLTAVSEQILKFFHKLAYSEKEKSLFF